MSTDVMDSGGQPALPPLPPPTAATAPPKSPGLALLLSFLLPGVGQVYNGQPAKAFVFFFAFVGSIYGATQEPLPFAFLIPFVHIYNLIDAYRSAGLINDRARGGGVQGLEETTESPAWGVTLMVLGFVILLNNLGWLDLSRLIRFWPVLLILAGAAFLRDSLRRRKETEGNHGPTFRA